MAEITKKLHYRRGGVTYDIKLYDSTADVGSNYMTLRVDGQNVYAKLGETDHLEASHLRVQKSGVTYSVLKSDMIELPSGFIGMFQSTCPTGWTRETAFDDRYVKGSSAYGATGGSATHSHTATVIALWSGYTGSPTKGTNDNVNIGGAYPCYDNHRHFLASHSFDTSTETVHPPYINVVYCRKV